MEKIKAFLSISSGYGSGSGSGDGYGYGSGSGDGYGYGSGSGVFSFNGNIVYVIDNLPTIIHSINGNIANGDILNSDLTLTPCYIVKLGNSFAHGKTSKEAFADAQRKELENTPLSKRIDLFCEKFKDGNRYKASEFFEWHGTLTWSCRIGRESFCKNKGIDLNSTMTVADFIIHTENEYGGGAIKELKKKYAI